MAIAEEHIPASSERRQAAERRVRLLRAVLLGGWYQRRRQSRRPGTPQLGEQDWHEPQWLAAAVLIMFLSVADAVLTLTLLEQGAIEINPLMRVLVIDGARSFVYLKMALTAGTVTLLVLLIRVRAFGRYLAGPILLTSALAYVVLVGYEYLLLMQGLD